MNPDWLLKHFDQISKAPAAVPRLRRFILDLAVRGRLVPQDPEDEPAIQLNEGTTSRFKETSVSFGIKPLWQLYELRHLTVQITDGEHATPPRIREQQVPLVTAKNVRDCTMDYRSTDWVSRETAEKAWRRCRPAVGDVLLVCVGATTGRVCVLREAKEMVLVRSVAVIRPNDVMTSDFLEVALRSSFCQNQIWKKVKVTAQPCLYINRIKSLIIPVPPISEQHRIVAKVNELTAFCDHFEAAQTKWENRRDRLVLATLHGIENGMNGSSIHPLKKGGDFSETNCHDAARFFFNNIPRLTTRSEHVQQLRQTILNLAVRGRLIPQDPNDEPASALLRKIQMERQGLMKSGKIKQSEASKNKTTTAVEWQIPESWEWAELQEVFHFITDGDHQPPPRAQLGIPFLVIGNVRNRRIELNADVRYVPKEYYQGLDEAKIPRKGKILYTVVGSYGIPILLTDDSEFCVQRHIAILTPSKHVSAEFLVRLLDSRLVFTQAADCATGIAQKTVPLSGLRRIRIPLPPIAEQHRIVKMVNDLMELCDQLENRLDVSVRTRGQALDAALNISMNEAGIGRVIPLLSYSVCI